MHTRTRRIAVGLGIAFTILPLYAWMVPNMAMSTFPRQLLWALACLGVISIFSLVNRPTTAINRRILHCARFLFVAQTINTVGMWSLGVDPVMTQVWNMLIWGVLVGTFAIMIDPWLNVIALAYFAGFLATTQMPEHRMLMMSASNGVLAIVTFVRWREVASR